MRRNSIPISAWRTSRLAIVSAVISASMVARPEAIRAQGLSVALAPPIIEKSVRAGTTLRDRISYTNRSDQPLMVSVDFADFGVDEKGEVQEMPAGTDPSTLARYIRITPLSIRVQPGRQIYFRYTVNAPPEFTQLRTQVFFSSRPVVTEEPNQVVLVARMGIPLYVENLSARPASLKVAELKWERPPGKSDTLDLKMRITNEGERNIRPTGFCEVRSTDGSFVQSFPFNDGREPLLPGQKREWMLSMAPVPAGALTARLRFTDSPRTNFEAEARIPPASQSESPGSLGSPAKSGNDDTGVAADEARNAESGPVEYRPMVFDLDTCAAGAFASERTIEGSMDQDGDRMIHAAMRRQGPRQRKVLTRVFSCAE